MGVGGITSDDSPRHWAAGLCVGQVRVESSPLSDMTDHLTRGKALWPNPGFPPANGLCSLGAHLTSLSCKHQVYCLCPLPKNFSLLFSKVSHLILDEEGHVPSLGYLTMLPCASSCGFWSPGSYIEAQEASVATESFPQEQPGQAAGGQLECGETYLVYDISIGREMKNRSFRTPN